MIWVTGLQIKATKIASQTLKEWVDNSNDSVTKGTAVELRAFLICIVFRARSKPHLDNRIAKERRIKKASCKAGRKDWRPKGGRDGRPAGKKFNWSQDQAR